MKPKPISEKYATAEVKSLARISGRPDFHSGSRIIAPTSAIAITVRTSMVAEASRFPFATTPLLLSPMPDWVLSLEYPQALSSSI